MTTVAWNELQELFKRRDTAAVAALVGSLPHHERRYIAKRLPGYAAEHQDELIWWSQESALNSCMLIAGVVCNTGAAAAATWLCRADLRTWWSPGPAFVTLLTSALSDRSVEWRQEVARRVSARLRASTEGIERETLLWRIAAALLVETGGAPPPDDSFTVHWVAQSGGGAMAGSPFLDALAPRLFEATGVAVHLTEHHARALVGLAAIGRLERRMLLDGCVGRFLRGGRAQDLRWYVQFHERLEPTLAEVTDRARDYLRLLPTAPSGVADLALTQLRRVDEASPLDQADFAEAVETTLFRTEKKLVRAAFTWADRTAKTRPDAAVSAVCAAFAHDAHDLRERAVSIAVKHASKVAPETRETLREAAAGLPADLRERIAAAYGAVDAPAPDPLPTLPVPAPEAPLPPIGSPDELAEEILVHLRMDGRPGNDAWPQAERIYAALVRLTHLEPLKTRSTMERLVRPATPWLGYDADWDSPDDLSLVLRAALGMSRAHVADDDEARLARPSVFVRRRTREIADLIRAHRVPELLSTPTESNGILDTAVFLDRLRQYEASNLVPGEYDLRQALLRLPRDMADHAAQAATLTSDAGHRAAAWIAAGGLPDPRIVCRQVEVPDPRHAYYPSHNRPTVVHILAGLAEPPADEMHADLLTLPGDTTTSPTDDVAVESWAWVLPSHPEIVAAHLLPLFARSTESRGGQGAALLGLARSEGPTGPATATALAYALGARHADERAGALDALLVLAARDRFPADDFGAALGQVVETSQVKLSRVVPTLADAARAGAAAHLWPALAIALPALLPGPDAPPRPGTADLLALATESAQAARSTQSTGPIQAVRTPTGLPPAILANLGNHLRGISTRSSSSRLTKEATRLHNTLTTR